MRKKVPIEKAKPKHKPADKSKKDKEKEEFDKRASRFVDTDLRYVKITPPPKKK
jgi:hypothetical protein